ncbi:MAG: HNH endonuclease [Candidatus Dormibacteria bacterium]
MEPELADRRIRAAAFDFVAQLGRRWGEVLPLAELRRGFELDGRRVPLIGPQGIFKPAVLDLPLSITTVPAVPGKPAPYPDQLGSDGYIHYSYRGRDPQHPDNRGLRAVMRQRLPLIYFYGVLPGQYLAQCPVLVVGDDPARLAFTVAVEDLLTSDPEIAAQLPEEARRAYVTTVARRRLHQLAFRHRVLRAYQESCAMCRLRQRDLLDAAHILPDTHPGGEPLTRNGLSLCKLHHAAFDRNIVGVRPDLVLQIRQDVLAAIDGPMLRHGLQDLHGERLVVLPRSPRDRPDPGFLEERYQLFQAAS